MACGDKVMARFLYPIETNAKTKDETDLGYAFHPGEKKNKFIESNGYVLDYVELEPEIAAAVKSEAEKWVIEDQYFYKHINEDYDVVTAFEEGTTYLDVCRMTSISSSSYLSNDILGDILVIDNHFAGVVIKITDTGGNGWSGSSYLYYCVMLTDGTILGSNCMSYSFSGTSSNETRRSTYFLKKREDIHNNPKT